MANQPKKYKKFVATAATATLVASAIVPVASAASFSDVSDNNEFAPFIDALTKEGIINGYPTTNTFKPGAALTRGQVVKMLGRWVENNGVEVPADWKTKARFTDVPVNSQDQELVKYAALVADEGVFGGAAGKLMAATNITRQQMAKVLNGAYAAVNGQTLVEIAEGVDNVRIPDLSSARAEYEDAIQALMDLEISSTTSGNFRPLENVTRAQFAKFLYNTINFEASDVSPFEIKAINNTTVEVIFQEDIESIDKVKFEIDGLKITNAVVKQTSKRTAVLTTESQKGGTEYTVKVDGEKAGTFVGIASVVPSKVELVSSSVQGKLGQEVKVQAKVTVAEGQSKANIPVTFNVPGNNNDTVNPTITGEAYTDENGIATYTYTRYAAKTDAVTAYATGDRSKFAVGYVFWGVDTILSIEEVTTGATINNGANKTYKVTYKNDVTGKPQAGVTLNVSALENINVTADKSQNVTVNGVPVAQFSNNTVTRAAQIVTDSNGQATFTVSGNHATVTPVVFAATPQYNTGGTLSGYSPAYSASALQATAAKVTFAAVQAAYTIEMTREGGEIAAIGDTNGGREYKIIVKDKDGKLAANEVVNVAFNEDEDKVIATETSAQFIDTSGDDQVFFTGAKAKQITVKTNSKGEATFVVGSAKLNDYVTPIAWIDINTSNASDGKLDTAEPTAVGPITHFQQQYVDGATLAAYDGNTKTTKFTGVQTATFKTTLANQSGLPYNATSSSIQNVTYTVTNTGSQDVEVLDGSTWRTVSPNRSISVSSTANLQVKPVVDATTSVKVTATGNATYTDAVTNTTKTFAFTSKEATALFTKVGDVPTAGYTGVITSYNTKNKTITFAGKNPVKYDGETDKTYVFKGLGGVTIPDGARGFLAILAKNTVTASYTVDGDTVTFAIQGQSAGSTTDENKTPEVKTLTFTSTEAITAGDVLVDGVKLGTVAASTTEDEFKVTLVEGKTLPTANFKATIAGKEYDFKTADGKWVATAVKVEEGDKVVTGEKVKITFVEVGAGINAVRVSKADAAAAGLEVNDASTLVLTFADGSTEELVYKADKEYFQNSALTQTKEQVEAAKVTVK